MCLYLCVMVLFFDLFVVLRDNKSARGLDY